MKVKTFPRSVFVGREVLAARAQEVLRQNDMGGWTRFRAFLEGPRTTLAASTGRPNAAADCCVSPPQAGCPSSARRPFFSLRFT